MTDPGLDRRLRQRSRRAGFMIGITMALAIVVCVAGFSIIYAALDDTIGDFVSRDVPAPVIPTEVAQSNPDSDSSTDPQPTAADDGDSDEPEESQPTPEPTEVDDAEFEPDYQSSTLAGLNFRTEPSTSGGNSTVIFVLPEGTLLQFTGETQPSDDPDDGEDGWMLFRIEDGREGWLRAIDVTELES